MASTGLRVAVTLEQCWHRVPGGTAASALECVRAAARRRTDVDLVGRERPPPRAAARAVDARRSRCAALPLPRLALYEAWHRLRRPAVERATGPVDVIHVTGMAMPPPPAPLVVTVHDLAFLARPGQLTAPGRALLPPRHRPGPQRRRPGAAARRRRPSTTASRTASTPAGCGWCRGGSTPSRSTAPASAGVRARLRPAPAATCCGPARSSPARTCPTLARGVRARSTAPTSTLVLVGPEGWNEDLGARSAPARRPGPGARASSRPTTSRALYAGRRGVLLPEPARRASACRCSRPWPRARRSSPRRARPPPRSRGDAARPGRPARRRARSPTALADLLDDPDERERRAEAGRGPCRAEFPWARDRRRPRSRVRARPPVADRQRRWRRDGGGTTPDAVAAVAGRRQPALARPRCGRGERGVHRRGCCGRSPAGVPDDLEVTLFVNGRFADAHPSLAERLPAPWWPRSTARRRAARGSRRSRRGWRREARADAASTCVHHVGGTMPLVRAAARLVTIHDLQPLDLPGALQSR